jgi:hypothetical protein
MAEGIVRAFNMSGDSATADSVAARLRVDSTSGRRHLPRTDVELSIVERADRLAPTDFRAAVALVDTLDDPLAYGRRERALARIAGAARVTDADTVASLLRRARESALAALLSPRQLSLTLLEIVERQLGRALIDDAAATLNAISDRPIALSWFGGFGGSRFELAKSDGERLLSSLRDPEIQAAAGTLVIGAWIASKDVPSADFAWAVSIADQLPRLPSAEAANVLVIRSAFFRGDTTAARNRALSILRGRGNDWTRWPRHYFGGDEILFWLVRSGGIADALTWARGLPSPASRAAGLLELGSAIDLVAGMGRQMYFSNAPACSEQF